MSKNIVITISGAPATGKTTLASEIAALLSDLGFSISIDDPDLKRQARSSALHHKALENMASDGLEITIKTVQTQR